MQLSKVKGAGVSDAETGVSRVLVDNTGIAARATDEVILDVLFDGRRIWSFWIQRDGKYRKPTDDYLVPWPKGLPKFLDGVTELTVQQHLDEVVLFAEEVRFGTSDQRIAVVNAAGKPLGIDKSGKLMQTFETRSTDQVAPLLDALEEVLAALKKAGIDAFPAYGTLLGAVRDGKLIGHDSDADIGYVSQHEHPVDVSRESFAIERKLVDMGYPVHRYSGAAFKVIVSESDGSARGLDVFGGFMQAGHLVLMGEIRTPFEREWIFPLGTTTLEGRELPAPADTDRFLAATYGQSWRVPDPAFQYETPGSTHRRLDGWFRGARQGRQEWGRKYQGTRYKQPRSRPNVLATYLHEQEPADAFVVDIGCGRGSDALWLAKQGRQALGLDFTSNGYEFLAQRAERNDLPVTYHRANLLELRHTLSWGARIAEMPGPRALMARHFVDATGGIPRQYLWRLAKMALSGGGRLYLEFLTRSAADDAWAQQFLLHKVSPELVIAELEGTGARVVSRTELETADMDLDKAHDQGGQRRRVCRLVVEWVR
ncbi:class I SAM-dependent methyltransferase [Nocardioides speluncae]|uniref:class I SAM-dependent methyltransferase n=1 Tax=Nocardioides speluncae TaxID=2670337 RepID=UPI0012B169BA|nr:class I SAM-dependent methyltransferase [Nocardioides speluncae]